MSKDALNHVILDVCKKSDKDNSGVMDEGDDGPRHDDSGGDDDDEVPRYIKKPETGSKKKYRVPRANGKQRKNEAKAKAAGGKRHVATL